MGWVRGGARGMGSGWGGRWVEGGVGGMCAGWGPLGGGIRGGMKYVGATAPLIERKSGGV